MNAKIEKSWKNKLSDEFEKEYFKQLISFVKTEYQSTSVYPNEKNIFSAFDYSSFENTRVIIIGQDPYHGKDQANGLCFSVQPHITIPPSLRNIFKEIHNDLGIEIPSNGDLSRWAKQGVLMLNATLTVRAHKAGSHQGKGWEQFTDETINLLSDKKENLVFLLWGAFAQKKGAIIDKEKHLILRSPHPSPFAAYKGFFGNKHFSRTNEFLTQKGLKPIDW